MHTAIPSSAPSKKAPWNKGRLIGQKRPLKPKDVWAIRVRLQLQGRKRDLALFNLAIDSKLRGCDLVRLQLDDVCTGTRVRDRSTVIQKKTARPVQFEITEQTRSAIQDWLSQADLRDRALSVPEPLPGAAAPLDPTIRADRPCLGRGSRARQLGLRNSLDAPDEGGADLQEDGKPACRSAPARTYEARKHRPLSRHRGRRRAQHFGAGRALKITSRPFLFGGPQLSRPTDAGKVAEPALRVCRSHASPCPKWPFRLPPGIAQVSGFRPLRIVVRYIGGRY